MLTDLLNTLPYGGEAALIMVLAGLVVADTLFGLAVAYMKHDLSSHVARVGFASKVATVAGVIILHEIATLSYLSGYADMVNAIVVAFIGFELLSVVENLTYLGILPKSFGNRLRIHQDDNDSKKDNTNQNTPRG